MSSYGIIILNLMSLLTYAERIFQKKDGIKKFKKQIYDSRIKSTAILSKKISNLEYKPKLFISSSAIGYYGNTNGETVDEQSHPGNDFLAKLSVDWEKATLAQKTQK